MMNEREAWEKFRETGTILDYLEYRTLREKRRSAEKKNADNDRRNRNKRKRRG